jgi:hypothetical protein
MEGLNNLPPWRDRILLEARERSVVFYGTAFHRFCKTERVTKACCSEIPIPALPILDPFFTEIIKGAYQSITK